MPVPYADPAKRNAQRKKRYHERKDDPEYHSRRLKTVQKYQKRHPAVVKKTNWKAKLKRVYGITVGQYEQMIVDQNNLCAICGKPPGSKQLFIDHNHTTNKARQLLCGHCNSVLGYALEDVNILKKCIAYLEKHNALSA